MLLDTFSTLVVIDILKSIFEIILITFSKMLEFHKQNLKCQWYWFRNDHVRVNPMGLSLLSPVRDIF